MSFEEMLNLEYSNRLHYIQKLLNKKSSKSKNWLIMGSMIAEEIARVEELC